MNDLEPEEVSEGVGDTTLRPRWPVWARGLEGGFIGVPAFEETLVVRCLEAYVELNKLVDVDGLGECIGPDVDRDDKVETRLADRLCVLSLLDTDLREDEGCTGPGVKNCPDARDEPPTDNVE